ncbi:MAG: tyrosine recombinase XerC [Planctomycetota bacterium]|jgi:integrase/recombinase XerC
MEDSTTIQHFLDYLRFERRFSEHTAKCYSADLKQFGEFLVSASETSHTDNGPFFSSDHHGGLATAVATPVRQKVDELLLSAETDSVRAYLTFLNEKQYSKATIARKVATLRSFYKFLVKRNQLTSNPVVAVRTPKQDKKLPRFLDYEEVKKLLDTPSLNNWLGSRDRAIMEMLYSTGIRVSELVVLNMDDIDFMGEVVHVRGKGKKERIAPIGSSALQVIQHYMEYRNKRAQNNVNFDSKVLFVNKFGKQLSTRSVRRKLDKYLKMAGLDSALSPHTLRHSFATHMLNNGADLRTVQELLGHQSRSTTQVYTHLMATKLKNVYENAHLRCGDNGEHQETNNI